MPHGVRAVPYECRRRATSAVDRPRLARDGAAAPRAANGTLRGRAACLALSARVRALAAPVDAGNGSAAHRRARRKHAGSAVSAVSAARVVARAAVWACAGVDFAPPVARRGRVVFGLRYDPGVVADDDVAT